MIGGAKYLNVFAFQFSSPILIAVATIGLVAAAFMWISGGKVLAFESPVMSQLRATKFFQLMRQYLAESIVASLFLSAFSMCILLVDPIRVHAEVGAIWSSLAAVMFLTFRRINNVFVELGKAHGMLD